MKICSLAAIINDNSETNVKFEGFHEVKLHLCTLRQASDVDLFDKCIEEVDSV